MIKLNNESRELTDEELESVSAGKVPLGGGGISFDAEKLGKVFSGPNGADLWNTFVVNAGVPSAQMHGGNYGPA